MNLPRIVHPFVVVLVLSLAATGLWAAAASEEPAAAAEKEMVLDPSTGEMVEAPQYGGTLTYGRSGLGEHTDYWYIGGWASHWISEVNEKLVIVDWALDRSVNNLRTYDLPWSVFVGALAESWETPDATTIIAHIRQGGSLAQQGTDEWSGADRRRRRIQLSSSLWAGQRLHRSQPRGW